MLLPIKYVTAEVRNSLYCYKNLCEHISFFSSPYKSTVQLQQWVGDLPSFQVLPGVNQLNKVFYFYLIYLNY